VEDDAIVADRETDCSRIRQGSSPDYKANTSSRAAVHVRDRRSHPVIIQAGQSGRGTSFAARWRMPVRGLSRIEQANAITPT